MSTLVTLCNVHYVVSGDIILKHKKSYIPIPGDRVVVLDAGANTYSLFRYAACLHSRIYTSVCGAKIMCLIVMVCLCCNWNVECTDSRHCSRRAPALYVFRGNPESVGEESQSLFRCIKPTEAEASVLAFWGEAEDK